MFIHIKSRWVEFFAGTKMRYYDINADDFINVKPGARLLINGRWLLSTDKGFCDTHKLPAVARRS